MTRPVLRLNQGDASEARIYYCAHFVAQSRGYFADEGIEVQFVTTTEGGHTVRGGQIPALLSGQADLTVGGPMVAMKMEEDGEARLSTFCAVAQGNPWILAAAGAHATQTRSLADLKGARILDIARVGTATMSFEWVLKAAGLDGEVEVVPGSGDAESDLAAVADGTYAFALHSLHALAPTLAKGDLSQALELATPTGAVPWSAYIARPDVIAQNRTAFVAFTRAIARAQGWMAQADAKEIAALVARHYPDQSVEALTLSLAGYRASGVLASSPEISVSSFDRFGRLLREIGWLDRMPEAALLLDMTLLPDGASTGALQDGAAQWI